MLCLLLYSWIMQCTLVGKLSSSFSHIFQLHLFSSSVNSLVLVKHWNCVWVCVLLNNSSAQQRIWHIKLCILHEWLGNFVVNAIFHSLHKTWISNFVHKEHVLENRCMSNFFLICDNAHFFCWIIAIYKMSEILTLHAKSNSHVIFLYFIFYLYFFIFQKNMQNLIFAQNWILVHVQRGSCAEDPSSIE